MAPLAGLILYLAFLIVVGGFAILWSGWPEKCGGWLLAAKQKLPPVMQLWHPRHVFPVFILFVLLFLLSSHLEDKALAPVFQGQ
jgi:hypothetical protein